MATTGEITRCYLRRAVSPRPAPRSPVRGRFQGFEANTARIAIEGGGVVTVKEDLIRHNDAYIDSGGLARQLGLPRQLGLLPAAGSPAAGSPAAGSPAGGSPATGPPAAGPTAEAPLTKRANRRTKPAAMILGTVTESSPICASSTCP